MPCTARSNKEGFTLVEMMIALFVGALLILISYNVLVTQNKAADAQNSYINAQQNSRVAIESMEKELRLAGLNVDDFNGQPIFIDAAPYQVVFNSDISRGVSGVLGMTVNQSLMLHDGTQYTPGIYPGEKIGSLLRYNNNAETIKYTLDQNDNGIVDQSDRYMETRNPEDYALYREENGTRKDIIAYGIRGKETYPDGQFPQPMFKYWGDYNSDGVVTLWGDNDGDGVLSQAEVAALGAVPQAGLDKIIDVEITVEAESDLMDAGYSGPHSMAGAPRQYRSVIMTSKVRPRNVATSSANFHACGDPPGAPSSLSAVDTPTDDGRSITLSFNASPDELGGEEDVHKYTIYRRNASDQNWACIGSKVVTGNSSYNYDDDESTLAGGPEIGESYYYFVTAWDCRPQESSPSNTAGPVQPIPNGPAPPTVVNAYDTPCDDIDEVSVNISKSPDDLASGGNVSKYRIYRGDESGNLASKTIIGSISADGSNHYTFLDNPTYNIGGIPPASGESYYYAAVAVGATADSVYSVPSNEYGPVYYSGTISACRLTGVYDYPDDEGDALAITWKSSPSEECTPNEVVSYTLKRMAVYETEWTVVYTTPTTGVANYSYVDDDLNRGTKYTYCVWTMGASDAVPSNEKSGIPLSNTDLEPPVNLAAEDILCDATGAINVTFEHSPQDIPASGSVDYYKIYRRQELTTYQVVGHAAADGSDSYLFVDGTENNPGSPPIIGEFYYYQATSVDSVNSRESAPSNEGYTMSDGEPGAPRITSAVDTPADAGKSITVTFDRSADDGHCTNNVIIYKIYRETDEHAAFNHLVGELTAVGQTAYTFYDDEIFSYDPPVDGIGYYYVVRAVEAGGEESVNSNIFGPVYSISQDPSSYIVFQDDFETDKGWIHGENRTQDDWQRGTPMGNGGADHGNPDPSSAYSGSNVFANDLGASGWNGDYQNNVDNYLMTPAGQLDCSGHTNLVLQFQRWLNVEQPAYDQAEIYISTNGHSGPWTRIWQNPNEITDNSWVFMEIDISNWADGESDVAIAFSLKTDGGYVYSGWNIDDFVIREKANNP
ncbi:MAG: prepilin-type N-terminal cleavage/methylation domain-containing protein [Candidatus Latescibacteria bacterium]|nr:prepilin-type N-terminal cleavage/methylation domain-containing protein [bacterium]MBD3423830.1 prepilin-type N-terminal cleavage/methylation domain-containing protein [Candidatus Latescibacterota bacterium]